MSEGSRHPLAPQEPISIKPEPGLGEPPLGEKIRRKLFEDKELTRGQVIKGGISLLGVMAVSRRNKIASFFQRRTESGGPPNTDTKIVPTAAVKDIKTPTRDTIKPQEIEGQRLSLEELIAAVEAQNEGNANPIIERLREYNSTHSGHETVTLDADENRVYHKTDTPVFGIYKLVPPANVRTSPRSDEENIALEISATDVADVFPDGYFLGYDLLGSKYEGSQLGNQSFDIGETVKQGIFDSGGVWIGIANTTRGEDGTNTFSPDDRLLPKNTDNHGAIPAVAALRVTAISIEQARTILSDRQSS